MRLWWQMPTRIGALTIGQAPRGDLIASISQVLPDVSIYQAGALDQLRESDLPVPGPSHYPLTTELKDGTAVTVEEHFLAPRLQEALDRLEEEEIQMTILLCSAPFESLRGRTPLLKPFHLCLSLLRSLGISNLGVVAPNEEQHDALSRKWSDRGIACSVWSPPALEDPTSVPAAFEAWVQEQQPELVLIDFYGFPGQVSASLQRRVDFPFVDIERLSISVMASCFDWA